MTLEKAVDMATLHFNIIGKEVKHTKKGKIKRVSRITAYQKKEDKWDVAVFFVKKKRNDSVKPDAFLDDFLEKYEVIPDKK